MRGKKAKKIRRLTYGDEDFRKRKYFIHEKSGYIIADKKRREYQERKKI